MKTTILIFNIALLSGCTVIKEDIVWSEVMCVNNGGLETITIESKTRQTVVCKNGATFVHGHDFFR